MAEGTLDSLERGLAAAEFVASRGHVSLAEVMTHLGVAKTTAYRALATLESRGWVARDSVEGGYRPGVALMRMFGAPQAELVRAVAETPLQELVDSVGETANLALLVGNSLVYEKVVECTQSLRTHAEVGKVADLHVTALGRAFLSRIDSSEVEERLDPGPYLTGAGQRLTTREEVLAAVDQARRDGFAVEMGETEDGAGCIAVALLDDEGVAIGAVSVSGPIGRLKVDEMSAALMKTCSEISERLQPA